MNNPIDMLKVIKNPREFVLKQVGVNNNPVLKNLIEMAERGDKDNLQIFLKNMLKEQGKDYDEIISFLK